MGLSPIQFECDNFVYKNILDFLFNPNCGYILFLMYYVHKYFNESSTSGILFIGWTFDSILGYIMDYIN